MKTKEILEAIEFRLQNLQENIKHFDKPDFQTNRIYYQERLEELESLYLWIKEDEDGNQ